MPHVPMESRKLEKPEAVEQIEGREGRGRREHLNRDVDHIVLSGDRR